MKNIKNLVVVLMIALVAFVAGGIVLNKVRAQENSEIYPPVIERLMKKFGLKEGEVKNVLDEVRQEHQQKMLSLMETRLEEAVKSGVINTEQKKALIKKQAEWQEQERQMIEEKKRWLKESGIDFEKLSPYLGGCKWLGFGNRPFIRGFRFGGI